MSGDLEIQTVGIFGMTVREKKAKFAEIYSALILNKNTFIDNILLKVFYW